MWRTYKVNKEVRGVGAWRVQETLTDWPQVGETLASLGKGLNATVLHCMHIVLEHQQCLNHTEQTRGRCMVAIYVVYTVIHT